MEAILSFYICFLNFFNTPIISKIKYIYYIILAGICLIYIINNFSKMKISKKNDIYIKLLIYMSFSIVSTISLCWGGRNKDIISAYMRVWMMLPILLYIWTSVNLNIIRKFISYSILINLINIIYMIKGTNEFGRVQGIFSHPNFYSFYIIFIIICVLYYIDTGRINKKIYYPYIAINIFMLAASGSKTAVLILFIIIIYQLKRKMKYKSMNYNVMMVIFILAITSITIFCFNESIKELRIFNVNYGLVENQINSFDWRVLKWKETFKVWEYNKVGMILGHGYRSELYYGGIKGFSMHNEYLRVLFNAGILGAFIMFNLLVGIVIKIFKIDNYRKRTFYVSILILIAIGSFTENLFVASETCLTYLAVIYSINSKAFILDQKEKSNV